MDEKEWEAYVQKMQDDIKSGKINDETWDDVLKYYVSYDQGLSWEYVWNYKGKDYGLYPLEQFGRYEFYIFETKESIIYKDIYEALDKIRIEGKSIKELYESKLIFFDLST